MKRKTYIILVYLLLLPMVFSELDVCNIDFELETTVDWIEIEYDEHGEYELRIYNKTNTSQLLDELKIVSDNCPIIPLCGEDLTLQSNDTRVIDTEYCDINLITTGVRQGIYNDLKSERDDWKSSLNDCLEKLEKNTTCIVEEKELDFTCEVIYPEEDIETQNNSENNNTVIMMIIGGALFIILLLFTLYFLLRGGKKNQSGQEREYRGSPPPRKQYISKDVDIPQEKRGEYQRMEEFQKPNEETRVVGKKTPDFKFFDRRGRR